jgi:hypothetical protein
MFDYFDTIRAKNNVPLPLHKYVCFCKPGTGIKPDPLGGRRYWVCALCTKLPIYHIYDCVGCENYFVYDFHHPDFCRTDALCWDCLQKDGVICGHTHPKINYTMPIMEPYLPKVKKYSAEELEDFSFDFN